MEFALGCTISTQTGSVAWVEIVDTAHVLSLVFYLRFIQIEPQFQQR